MSRIAAAFENRTAKGQKAFIPFLTAGDPDLASTERFILALAENGADIIEIGIPFSDPAADGPVIQRANLRAMEAGVNVHSTFDMLARVREKSDVALAFLLYANIVYSYGVEAFFRKCKEVGIDGVIIADAPYEEEGEFAPAAKANGVDMIRLISPTSTERTEMLAKDATGFLYCVSSMGVTGVRENVGEYLADMFREIRKYCKIPTAIGFGIGSPEQALAVKDYADGVIVGSAVIKLIEQHGKDAAPPLTDFVRAMRKALD